MSFEINQNQRVCKNRLMKDYLNADIQLQDIFEITVQSGMQATNVQTLPNCFGIVIPLSGEAHYNIEGTSYKLVRGHVLFSAGGLPLSKQVVSSSPYANILLHYQVKNKQDMSQEMFKDHFMFKADDYTIVDMIRIADQLKENQKKGDLVSKLANKALLWRLIHLALPIAFFKCCDMETGLLEGVTDYIYDNLHKELSIQEIASKYNMDAKKFSQHFRKQFGQCPKKYILNQKIHYAKSLLMQTQLSVQEVAYRSGYGDPFYFSRLFKKHTGMSPSQYQTQNEKNPY